MTKRDRTGMAVTRATLSNFNRAAVQISAQADLDRPLNLTTVAEVVAGFAVENPGVIAEWLRTRPAASSEDADDGTTA